MAKKTRKDTNSKYTVVGVPLPIRVKKAAARLAAADHRSLSNWCALAIMAATKNK